MRTICPRTDSLLQALRAGELTREGEEHVAGCSVCAEALLVERWFCQEVASIGDFARPGAPSARGGGKPRPYTDERPLPDPGVIWWRADRDRRVDAACRAALPIVLVERAAWLVAATVAGLALVVWAADLFGAASTRAASPAGAAAPELLIGVAAFLGLVAFAAYRDWVEA